MASPVAPTRSPRTSRKADGSSRATSMASSANPDLLSPDQLVPPPLVPDATKTCDKKSAESKSKPPGAGKREMSGPGKMPGVLDANGEELEPLGQLRSSRSPRREPRAFRRSRSLYGVNPSYTFGPKGSLQKCNTDSVLTIQDPSDLRLKWDIPPKTVLVVLKPFDDSILPPFKELCSWLILKRKMKVLVEEKALLDVQIREDGEFADVRSRLSTYKEGKDELTDQVDFIVCLGGDGTLLYASTLFQSNMPPVMSFQMGSLGFLTPFRFENYVHVLTQAIQGGIPMILRTRLKCSVQRHDSSNQTAVRKLERSRGAATAGPPPIVIMNEVVIDRGPNPYLCQLDLYVDHLLATCVMGDGLIISTPTGSTAYAAAAGASMIHPSVPAMVICPICPHSLSFRPIIVPAGVEIQVRLSPDARNNAWASFDGKHRQELFQGDCVRITTYKYALPSLCREDQLTDWFSSLAECLHWNVRKPQKSLNNNLTSTPESPERLEKEELASS